MSDNFKWDDKIATEWAIYYREAQGNAEELWGKDLLEHFKKSKEKDIPKGWERVDKETNCGFKILAGALLPNERNHQYINSIQRVSDNEKFSIGDEVYITNNEDGKYKFIISKFELEPNCNLMATAKGTSCRWHFSLLKKDIPKDKDWQIVSYNPKDYVYSKNRRIHSIMRLSDGIVFSIGDETKNGKIERFYIISNHLLIETDRCDCLSLEYQEKVKPKEWEILSFKHNSGSQSILELKGNGLYYWNFSNGNASPMDLKYILSSGSFKIHSVKRVLDNITFHIGDNTDFGEIKGFEILKDNLMYVLVNNSVGVYGIRSISLKSIQKVKPKEALFTTEDGVEIFEGQTFYEVSLSKWYIFAESQIAEETHRKYYKYFSTRKLAELYVQLHKPIEISCTEFLNATNVGESAKQVIRNFFKSKINP